MTIVWIAIVFAIIISLAILMVFTKPKLANIEAFDVFKTSQLAFGDSQYTYYNDRVNKEIILNPGIDYHLLPQSIRQANINVPIPISNSKPIMNRFYNDPTNEYTDADKKFCRSAASPSHLPARPSNAKVACGWFYVEDPTVPSVGTLGTYEKPLFPETLPSQGEWIWDIPTAIMKESIKRCKQIKNCNVIDASGLNGKCGFCPSLGYAIPIKSDGTEQYPDVTSCGSRIIRSSKDCVIPVQSVVTPDGHECGGLGHPSPDNSLRFYTKGECATIDSDASLAPSGECLKPGGAGSYSYDCRTLNAPLNVPSICDPNREGKLSRECLLSLCKGMGYTAGGAVVRLLSNPLSTPSDMDLLAIHILNTIGVTTPTALIGGGDIDVTSAKDLYYNLILVTQNGTQELYREAGKWLVYGTNNFHPCDVPDETRGPFIDKCIQMEFRKAGCQPAGTQYPKTPQQFGKYYNYKWSNVKQEFNTLYNNMKDPNGDEQDVAVQQCLGIGVLREAAPTDDWTQNIIMKWDNWTNVPGRMKSISVGSDGSVWGIRQDNTIWYSMRVGGSWSMEGGQLVQISARSMNSGMIAGINDANSQFRFISHGGNWSYIGGPEMWVSVGADGTRCAIGANQSIILYTQDDKTVLPGSLVMCSVVNQTNIWGVNGSNEIYRWNGTNWRSIPGSLIDIAASEDGSKVVGVNPWGSIFMYVNNTWLYVPGKNLSRISISNNYVVGINNDGEVFYKALSGCLKK